MAGPIRYIKFSGDYDEFDEWKEKTKEISSHKGILKYLTKEVEIPTEYEAENDEEKLISMNGTPRYGISLSSAWQTYLLGWSGSVLKIHMMHINN